MFICDISSVLQELSALAAVECGVADFACTLAPRLAFYGIQLAITCPRYVNTPLVQTMLKRQPELAKVC